MEAGGVTVGELLCAGGANFVQYDSRYYETSSVGLVSTVHIYSQQTFETASTFPDQ